MRPQAAPQSDEGGRHMKRDFDMGGITPGPNQEWIAHIGKERTLKIPTCEVLYIEQTGKQLDIHKSDRIVYVPGRLAEASNQLEEPFYQCHSYLMINIARVVAMTKGTIIFDNGREKYVGRENFAKTRKKFNNYLLGKE